MTTLDTRPEDVRDPEASATWRPLGWHQTLLMNLGPAAIAFAAGLALAPLLARLGLPRFFSFAVAEALVLTPIELRLLLRAAHRATGRWSLRALPAPSRYPNSLEGPGQRPGWSRRVPGTGWPGQSSSAAVALRSSPRPHALVDEPDVADGTCR